MKLAQKIAITYIRAKLNILAVLSKKKAARAAMKIFSTPFRKSKKQTPPVFKKAENISFKMDGNTIRGYRWNAGKENKLLIIHGFESSSKNFDRYIMPLVKQGYQVLAFDAPAHGQSGGKQVNLLIYVKMLHRIHELYGPISSYLSHSFGGLAVTHFLETIPHDETVKLVLVAPATESTSAIDSFFKILHLGTDIRKEFDQLILDKSGVSPDHYSIRRAIKNIKAKILWFHDEDDELTPIEDALRVREENHSHIEFVITKGLGHRKIYRENMVVKRIITFCGANEH
ncbi:MAG: alpha/beta hydrolase [Chitinophagaceae bacterium]|nr:alpha/beta hydrolase [Chitinophagaceae bacterium]